MLLRRAEAEQHRCAHPQAKRHQGRTAGSAALFLEDVALHHRPVGATPLDRPIRGNPALLGQDPMPAQQVILAEFLVIHHLVAQVVGQVLPQPRPHPVAKGFFFWANSSDPCDFSSPASCRSPPQTRACRQSRLCQSYTTDRPSARGQRQQYHTESAGEGSHRDDSRKATGCRLAPPTGRATSVATSCLPGRSNRLLPPPKDEFDANPRGLAVLFQRPVEGPGGGLVEVHIRGGGRETQLYPDIGLYPP